MAKIQLSTASDDVLLPYRDLAATGNVRSSRFVVEGKWLVERLLESPLDVESIVVSQNHADEFEARLERGGRKVPLFVANWEQLQELVGFKFHRGVMACGRRPPNPPLTSLVGPPPSELQPDRVLSLVVCVDIQDAENLGGILRNAAAFGVDGVIVGGRSVPVYSRRVLRVSMGTVFRMTVRESESLAQDLELLQRQHDVRLLATTLSPDATHLAACERPPRYALVLGNEAQGLDLGLLGADIQRVSIPMHAGVDSLNVATASGVFLYHFQQAARQSRE